MRKIRNPKSLLRTKPEGAANAFSMRQIRSLLFPLLSYLMTSETASRVSGFQRYSLGQLPASAMCLALSVLLTGCAVGPNYHPPKTEVNPAFANGVQTNLAPAATAINWWRGFNDKTLDQLVDFALATNQDLQIATARVKEARALRNASVDRKSTRLNSSHRL